jgi:alpha-glucosidase
MNWNYLYHDTTPFYTSKSEANLGDSVTVRLRLPAIVKPKEVLLVVLKYGEISRSPMKFLKTEGSFQYFEGKLELHALTTKYIFNVLTETDSLQFSSRGVSRVNPPFRDFFQFLADHHRPDWLEDRVFYQIFPDRFENGDPSNDVQTGEYMYGKKPVVKKAWDELPTRAGNVFEHFGGDLQGITKRLDYLEELGVNGIYLNPIFTSPSNHRYDIQNFLEVDPHLGSETALRELLEAAHARGFKVILDGVFNHTGDKLPAFQHALEGGLDRQMYTFLPGGKYEAFFGVPTLPKLDFASQMTFEHFLEEETAPVRYWIRFGADGWRLDVAHMMGASGRDDGNLAIHKRLKAAVRLENPEAWVFGERFWDAEAALQGPNDYANFAGGGEDGVMNYQGFALPVTDWLSGWSIFDRPVNVPTTELENTLLESYRVVPHPMRSSHYNLIGSHDVPRLLERLKGDVTKHRTALALMLAYPGVPGIYYGDEIGMMGGGDPLNRAPMIWDEKRWNKNLHEDVKKLIRARRSSRALQAGNLVWLATEDQTIAFARAFTDEAGHADVAIIAATRDTSITTLQLDLKIAGVETGVWQDVLTFEQFTAQDGILELPVSSVRVLLPVA